VDPDDGLRGGRRQAANFLGSATDVCVMRADWADRPVRQLGRPAPGLQATERAIGLISL
jgi:hypothetical protein